MMTEQLAIEPAGPRPVFCRYCRGAGCLSCGVKIGDEWPLRTYTIHGDILCETIDGSPPQEVKCTLEIRAASAEIALRLAENALAAGKAQWIGRPEVD